MDKIRIESGDISLVAELNGSDTANRIYQMLPLSGMANVWGDEIYFTIPVHIDQAEDARQEVAVGDLGFWPVGDAFCIFFGPTPVSTGNVPKAYSPVNVFGQILGDATELKKVKDGDEVKVTREI
jgi:hypothetical protein